MARPKPQIFETHTDRKYLQTQIVSGKGIFFVTYMGEPMNVLTSNALLSVNSNGKPLAAKYVRTTFVNKGHAVKLAGRLNKLFNTDQFKVAQSVQFKHI